MSWRKGLRWDKNAKRWRDTKTNRLLTAKQLAKRKGETEKADPGDVAYERLKTRLKKAADDLKERGYRADARIHRNRDGSIDGELRVKPKRGQTVNDVLLSIEEEVSEEGYLSKTWISSGVRYHPRADEEFYERFQGMSQVSSYSQRHTKAPTNFVTARVINRHLEKKGRRKPEQVFTRIHWNKKGKRPE